jgi:hypothetical protein
MSKTLHNVGFLLLAGNLLGLLFSPEDGGSIFLRNISEFVWDVESRSLIECLLRNNLVYMYLRSQFFLSV